MSNEDFKKLVGANVRKYRKQRDFTLQELSKVCGFPISRLSCIENGIDNPTIETMAALARALGVTLKDIFDF